MGLSSKMIKIKFQETELHLGNIPIFTYAN